MNKNKTEFLKKWLSDTYMEKAEIIEFEPTYKEKRINGGKLKINFNNNVIRMKLEREQNSICRGDTYSETEKMQIDGYGIRRIAERGC